MRIVRERVLRLSQAIKDLGLEPILKMEEDDPQYLSVFKLRESIGPGNALVLSMLTALVSYRLTMKGERWWACFSEYFSSKSFEKPYDVLENLLKFLDYCEGARIQRDAKKRRILKVWKGCQSFIKELLAKPELFIKRYKDFLYCESKSLNQRPNMKTLVFSIKMGYYVLRSEILHKKSQIEIDIPVDTRVACITYSSGIVEAEDFRSILKKPDGAINAWREVSLSSGIPLINLDALLWRIGDMPKNKDLTAARREIYTFLRKYVEDKKAQRVSIELVVKECK